MAVSSDRGSLMRAITLLLLTCILILSIVTAGCGPGAGGEEWRGFYGGPLFDKAYSVLQTPDGGFIIAGQTASSGAGWDDFLLFKVDSQGDEVWSNTYGGFSIDRARCLVQTSDGGYILVGITDSYGAGGADFWLLKTDEEGVEEWSKAYGGPEDDSAYSAQQTLDGGYIIGGYTGSYGEGEVDFWLVKTDERGNMSWSRTYGGVANDVAYSVEQTNDGGYLVAGWTDSYGPGGINAWMVKTDELGNVTWDRTYGGNEDDKASSVQQTSDGGYIIAGSTKSYGAGKWDLWLVKVDENGNEEWNRTFGGPDSDGANSVRQTSDGGYIVVGETNSYVERGADFFVIKTDVDGEEEWSRKFDGIGFEVAYAVRQTSDGGYIVAGETAACEDETGCDWDALVIKLKK